LGATSPDSYLVIVRDRYERKLLSFSRKVQAGASTLLRRWRAARQPHGLSVLICHVLRSLIYLCSSAMVHYAFWLQEAHRCAHPRQKTSRSCCAAYPFHYGGSIISEAVGGGSKWGPVRNNCRQLESWALSDRRRRFPDAATFPPATFPIPSHK